MTCSSNTNSRRYSWDLNANCSDSFFPKDSVILKHLLSLLNSNYVLRNVGLQINEIYFLLSRNWNFNCQPEFIFPELYFLISSIKVSPNGINP